jgi:hypothetical protein
MPMKCVPVAILLFITLSAFVRSDRFDIYSPVKNESFAPGEVLDFKMNYGIFTVGRGSAKIQPGYFKLNNRECFKVDVTAKTVGLVNWVSDVDDYWGAYIDTAALVPHQFSRKQREGSYKKDEWTYFDHLNQKIQVNTLDHKTGKMKDPKIYNAPAQVRDMIGGFLYLRTIDFSKVKQGDTLVINGFLEDEFYKLKLIYQGKDVIKVKAGKFRTIKLVPLMPKNKMFDGENSVTAWFSDDKNRIPVKINAEMFIGSAGVELTKYSGLKNPANLAR